MIDASTLGGSGYRTLLSHRPYRHYLASSTTGVFASAVDFLALGWLIVSVGPGAWGLAPFLAIRIGVKSLLAVPAGLIADRYPRATIYFQMRMLSGAASLIGVFAALQGSFTIALVAAAVSAVSHAVDLPAHRALQGEVLPDRMLERGISLASGGGHAATLVAPVLAVALGASLGMAAPLGIAAAAFFVSALAASNIPRIPCTKVKERANQEVRSALRFVRESPVVIGLLLASAMPPVIDKTIAVMLPSASGGEEGTSFGLVLAASEMGAISIAVAMAAVQWRFSPWIPILSATVYAFGVVAASVAGMTLDAMLIASALFLAGCAKTALMSSSLAGIQRHVPAEMRGRIMTI